MARWLAISSIRAREDGAATARALLKALLDAVSGCSGAAFDDAKTRSVAAAALAEFAIWVVKQTSKAELKRQMTAKVEDTAGCLSQKKPGLSSSSKGQVGGVLC